MSPLARIRTITFVAVGLAGLTVLEARAQQTQQVRLPPGVSAEQALQMTQQDPALGERLRQQLLQSGLTPDQVRARLRASGYPSGMLDAYLAQDSLIPPDPTIEMVNVISSLGIASFTERDSLLFGGDTLALRLMEDSLRLDSILVADSLASIRRGLELFGLEVFRQPTTQFQPVVGGPVDDSYVLGPGDELVLFLTGDVQRAFQLPVTRGGFIVVERGVGQINVNGLTIGQLREVLYERLGAVYSGVTRGPDPRTRFDITVSNVRVNTIRVSGEVNRPGSYQVAATGGVLSALYDAGGLQERANFRSVEVRRGTRLVATVDLYNYLTRGQTPSDVRLASGDVVFVPIRGPRIRVAGEVKRPGIYELKPDEGLRELLEIAGGLTAEASVNSATIDRILPPEERSASGRNRTVLTVDVGSVLNGRDESVLMTDGDSLTVFRIENIRRNAVSIEGSVWQPGTYQLESGMRFWDLVQASGGLRPETYQGRAQIVRVLADSSTIMIGVALPSAGAPPTDNPLLQEFDGVTVFSRAEFRPERYVAVQGAVQRPGIVAFSDSMTLRDAVLLAGGALENAYLTQAEISRIRTDLGDNGDDSLAVALTVPLDSSFVLEDGSYIRRRVGTQRAPQVYLNPYDNVFIRHEPGFEMQRNVKITGEVRFPGTYSLLTREERLLPILNRAGGLRSQAYANGIRFFRVEGGAGRIGINLPEVLRDPAHQDNIVLAAGDSIHIPLYLPTVRVEGAVNSPASVTFTSGKGIGYYIDAAGGFSRQADKGGKFVQQPNGLIEKGGRPEPGAVVVVPERDPADRVDKVALFSSITGILASITTVIIVALNTN
jgi:protein involved in polysaccharide export with SLBB domain